MCFNFLYGGLFEGNVFYFLPQNLLDDEVQSALNLQPGKSIRGTNPAKNKQPNSRN